MGPPNYLVAQKNILKMITAAPLCSFSTRSQALSRWLDWGALLGAIVGLDIAAVKLLLCAKNARAFSSTLQIGRQGMRTDVRSLGRALAVSRISADAPSLRRTNIARRSFRRLARKPLGSSRRSDVIGGWWVAALKGALKRP